MADHPQKVATRPLSPFVTIYRWPITMATSIIHRMTGMALAGGTLFLAWWLIAAASGPETYQFFYNAAVTPLGQIVMFGFVWSLAYHLVNGIRHLAWDFGYGLRGVDGEQDGRAGLCAVAGDGTSAPSLWPIWAKEAITNEPRNSLHTASRTSAPPIPASAISGNSASPRLR